MHIRAADIADADAISAMLVASITRLCALDHGDDPEKIRDWCADKTPDAVAGHIAESRRMWLAEVSGTLAAVGAIDANGRIALLYVAPAFRYQRLSDTMLSHLEAEMAKAGHRDIFLEATKTALPFYRARGWATQPGKTSCGGLECLAMSKQLQPA